MRIIITNDGIKAIRDSFDDYHDDQRSIIALGNKEIVSNYNSRSRTKLNSGSRTNHYGNGNGNGTGMISESLNSSNIDIGNSSYKSIEIRQKRLSIPSDKSLLYDFGKEESGHIIKHMPEIIMNLKSNNNNSSSCYSSLSSKLPKLKQSYSLEEIILPECFKKLKERLKNAQKIELNNRRTDERVFRNNKTGKEIFNELNTCKKSLINAANTSMIEYLLGKTTISDCFVKKLSSYRDNQINRLNKISQRILMRKEKEKVNNKEMQSKIDFEKINEKNNYKAEIESIEENIKTIKKLVDKEHPSSKKDKQVFKFLHSELIKDYWKNNKYDRYFFNANLRKNKLCHQYVSSRSIRYFKNALPFFPKKADQ